MTGQWDGWMNEYLNGQMMNTEINKMDEWIDGDALDSL